MKVLLATDGSPSAIVAHELVAGTAWPAGSEVTVLTVAPLYAGTFGIPAPVIVPIDTGEIDNIIVEDAVRIAGEAAASVGRPGVTVTPIARRGRPATVIADEAARLGVDLVIVGCRGIGGVESLLLGSVSSELVDQTSAPVLVVRKPSLDRIVLTVDGSGAECRPARLLETWPIFRGAAIRVLSVSDVGLPWWSGMTLEAAPLLEVWADAESISLGQHKALVDEVVAACRGAGLKAEGTVREGSPVEEILAEIGSWGADLVILGCRGKHGLQRLLVGSVARDVLHHADCSVLIAKVAMTTAAGAPTTAEPS